MAMKYCKIVGMVKVNYDVEIRLENNLYAKVKRNEKKRQARCFRTYARAMLSYLLKCF
jgi:hypothetical protein